MCVSVVIFCVLKIIPPGQQDAPPYRFKKKLWIMSNGISLNRYSERLDRYMEQSKIDVGDRLLILGVSELWNSVPIPTLLTYLMKYKKSNLFLFHSSNLSNISKK